MFRIHPLDGSLAVSFDFNREIVDAFKARTPWNKRRWSQDRRLWLVTPDQGPALQELNKRFFGSILSLPARVNPAEPQTRLLEVIYLATVKDRGPDNEPSAYSYVGSDWSIVFPESVLLDWFGLPRRKADKAERQEPETFYAILGIKPTALLDEVKPAYRRMAKLWHPDVTSEPDAAARFRAIHAAYEVLGDVIKRKKYDFGLALEQEERQKNGVPAGFTRSVNPDVMFRPPLRSGFILATGIPELSWFKVSEILEWTDIVRTDGLTLVSSWPYGAKSPRLEYR